MKDVLRWIVYVGIFAVPFIPLLVTDSLFFPYITGKNFTFRIIIEIVFASWILLALLDTQYRPRFSWILAFFASFIGILFLADVFSENPAKSFWSNFERMEGFVALVHLFLYFVVLSSVMQTQKLWNYFFYTTMFAASIVSIIAFRQLAGDVTINQGGLRIDATLGNATYMAVYMLFHVFIALFMLVRSQTIWTRLLCCSLALVFMYLLVQTATRGTILGLVGGLLLAALFTALFMRGQRAVRNIAIGGLVFVVLLIGSFFVLKDTEFVAENPILSRIASISLEQGSTRFTIWGMALEGVKDRPILGWGQESFNYVFNREYDPSLYAQEAWFDRVHNIFLDWLIATGILGFVAYFGVLFATLHYLVARPLLKKDNETFSVPERGILLGLLAGYFFHNLFVFDNIISYIFYATIIAYVHARVGVEVPRISAFRIDTKTVTNVVTPVVVLALGFSMYIINVPNIRAAGDIIDVFRYIQAANDQRITADGRGELLNDALGEFEIALARNSFANQEIREQLVRNAQQAVGNQNISTEIRERYAMLARDEIETQAQEVPNDARIRLFASSLYRAIGDHENALRHLEAARALSPQKQALFFEEAIILIQIGETERAEELLKEAYELDTSFTTAAALYAAAATYNDNMDIVDQLLSDEGVREAYNRNNVALQALYATKQADRVIEVLEVRLEQDPDNLQLRVSLAAAEYENGNSRRAIEIIENSMEQFPAFRTQGTSLVEGIRAGRPIESIQ